MPTSKDDGRGTIAIWLFPFVLLVFSFAMYCAFPAIFSGKPFGIDWAPGPAGAFVWCLIASGLAAFGVFFGVAGIGERLDHSKWALVAIALHAPIAIAGAVFVLMYLIGRLGLGPY